MKFFDSSVIIGLILIAIGASIFLKAAFNIEIPVMKYLPALILIGLGIWMITN